MRTPEDISRLRLAKRVCTTAIHPDTDELIPWVCRLTSFVPIGMPLIYGMLVCPPTPFNTIFFQWANQTYNAPYRTNVICVIHRDVLVDSGFA